MLSSFPWKSGTSTSTEHPGTCSWIWRIVSAKMYAPKSGRSSRSTDVITACCNRISRDGGRDTTWLGQVVLRRTPVGDRAIPTIAGADVAQDHERCGAVLPTLADVRAMRFLAHGMEVQLAHQMLQSGVIRHRPEP